MAEKKKSAPVSSGPVKPEDKKKALETALAQIEKNFGKGAIMRLGDDIPVNVEAISTGSGPRKVMISLGYSAWGEGQLESELIDNAWLTVEADARLIFDTPVDQRYTQALQLLGLEAWMLSGEAGHA